MLKRDRISIHFFQQGIQNLINLHGKKSAGKFAGLVLDFWIGHNFYKVSYTFCDRVLNGHEIMREKSWKYSTDVKEQQLSNFYFYQTVLSKIETVLRFL